MYGNKSIPSRIYSYGANLPMENAQLVSDQMHLAHRYRNNIVEHERKRRDKVDLALCRMSPTLRAIQKEIKSLKDKEYEIRKDIKKDRVKYTSKEANDPEKTVKMTAIKKQLDDLYAESKKIKKVLFATEKWKKDGAKIEEWADREWKSLQAKSGLYWGTYLHVQNSMAKRRSGAPPQFKHWDGDGHLAVQIQKGMSAEEALSGEDNRIRITEGRVEVDGTLTHKTGIKRKLGNAICHFRIGSDPSGGPVFAKIPFTLHRPLPSNAKIKWVHLIRRRISNHCAWFLQFVFSAHSRIWDKKDWATEGTVGIDLGWRVTDDGGLRIATWVGSDGKTGELALDPGFLGEMRRVEGIRSTRDENFNDAQNELIKWMEKRKGKLPDWFKTETETLSDWKSTFRLSSLVIKWRDQRFKGDDDIFFFMEEWRKRDKHLYEIEANLRDQLENRREYIYREFSAKLRRQYKTIKMKDIDLRKIHKTPDVDEEQKDAAIKMHARDAALSVLIRCLTESMKETAEVSPKNTTSIHHGCGSKQEIPGNHILHTCTKCGEAYDRDENAAKNILHSKTRAS